MPTSRKAYYEHRGQKPTREVCLTKIAIVEDERSLAQMYKYKLEREGYFVCLAYNGIDGYKICDQFRPSLLLLDLRLPLLDGSAFLSKLRSTKWGSNIRVIILTNVSKGEAPSALRFLHVDRYIVKVYSTPQQVLKTVREVLNSKPANTTPTLGCENTCATLPK